MAEWIALLIVTLLASITCAVMYWEVVKARKEYKDLANAILKRTVGIDPGKKPEKPKDEEPTENPNKLEATHTIP